MDPEVSSTPHSVHGIHLHSRSHYDTPTPVNLQPTESSDGLARHFSQLFGVCDEPVMPEEADENAERILKPL